MIRLGLCCIFRDEPIKFRTTTAAALSRLTKAEARAKLAELCAANAESLHAALQFCAANGIGSFRINSGILPLKTHPVFGYELVKLPGGRLIRDRFEDAGRYARANDLRTAFHPDQFVVLNSPRADVVRNSVEELEYQAEVSEWVGADVLNIHGGGVFGDMPAAVARFRKGLKKVSKRVRERLTLENDDRLYAPSDLLPVCRDEGIPLVYDVHHHRCHPGAEPSPDVATRDALATWNREPLFHISSPIAGWKGKDPRHHHDFINMRDFPAAWRDLTLTIEVEAKAKELAVLKLRGQLGYNRPGEKKPAARPRRKPATNRRPAAVRGPSA